MPRKAKRTFHCHQCGRAFGAPVLVRQHQQRTGHQSAAAANGAKKPARVQILPKIVGSLPLLLQELERLNLRRAALKADLKKSLESVLATIEAQ